MADYIAVVAQSLAAKAVIQNVYWRPLWASDSVVYSQYFVSIETNKDD